jgi:hypothetical protein
MRRGAKPPAQPVGMAESDMNKSSWQNRLALVQCEVVAALGRACKRKPAAYQPFLTDISTPQYEPAHIAPPRRMLFIGDTYPRCHNGAQLIKQRGLDHVDT